MRRDLFPAALAAVICACGSNTGPSGTLAGHWTGFAAVAAVDVQLSESSGSVLGTGDVALTSGGPKPVVVSGSIAGNSVSLTLTGIQQTFSLQGTLDGGFIQGTLTGPGLTGQTVILQRQATARAPKVYSVTVTPSPTTVAVGGTRQMTATTIADVGAATTVTWTVSSAALASVNASGLVAATPGATAGNFAVTACSTMTGFTGVCGSASVSIAP